MSSSSRILWQTSLQTFMSRQFLLFRDQRLSFCLTFCFLFVSILYESVPIQIIVLKTPNSYFLGKWQRLICTMIQFQTTTKIYDAKI